MINKRMPTMEEINEFLVSIGPNSGKVQHVLVGKVANAVIKAIKQTFSDTPKEEAIQAIKDAGSNGKEYMCCCVHLDGTITNETRRINLVDIPQYLVVDGNFFFLEGTKYIYRFNVDDISYADVLGISWDDDEEEEEYITVTHLMGDLTSIPF